MALALVDETSKPLSAMEQAVIVIDFLNAKTGRHYPTKNPRGNPTANAEIVMHRLKEGYTIEDCKSVVAKKCREWAHDEKMSRYLTPDILFKRSKFEKYIGELND
jgi:uncharacterized phage protein (TIGR02220 family)